MKHILAVDCPKDMIRPVSGPRSPPRVCSPRASRASPTEEIGPALVAVVFADLVAMNIPFISRSRFALRTGRTLLFMRTLPKGKENDFTRTITAVWRAGRTDRVPISNLRNVRLGSFKLVQPEGVLPPADGPGREWTDCLYMAGIPGPDFGHSPDRYEWHERREADKLFMTSTWHTPKGDLVARYRRDDSVHTQWTLEHRLKTLDDIDKYLSMGWEIKNTPDLSDFARAQRDLGDHGI